MIGKGLLFLLPLFLATRIMALELTVEDCVQLGLQQNEELLVLQAAVEVSHQDARIAYSERFPTLSLESSFLLRDKPPSFTLEANLFGAGLPWQDVSVEGASEHYSIGLTLRHPLYTGGRLSRTYQRQTFLHEARLYQLAEQKSRLVQQIKSSFYHTLTRQDELTGMAESVRFQEEELRILTELLQAGKATAQQISASRSRLLFARADLLKAEQALQNARDDLSTLMATEQSFDLKESTLYWTLPQDFAIKIDEVLDERQDVKQIGARLEAAHENIQVARSGYYPQLNIQAGYLKQRETVITEAEVWEAGLTLSWPIYEAGRTDAEVARAKAEQLRLKYTRQGLERSVGKEASASLRRVRQDEMLIEAYQLQLMATEEEYDSLSALYAAGKKQELDLLRQRARLATAHATYRAAINRARTSLVELETVLAMPLTGVLLEHEIYQPRQRPVPTAVTAVAPLPLPENSSTENVSGTAPYAIQLGAFHQEENALQLLNELKTDFPEVVFELISRDGWHKVRAGQIPSQELAEATLARLSRKGLIVHADLNHARTDRQ